MPGGDRTGPARMGPMTGRRMGYCAGYNNTDAPRSSWFGRGFGYGAGFGFRHGAGRGNGFGYGRGFGRGFGRGEYYYDREYIPDVNERELLKHDIKDLKEQLEFLQNKLSDLERED
jgi:hypothetical protein